MPRPPRGDEVTELSFIVNYFIQGCRPPFWLFVELSKAPLKDLALLIFGLEAMDIGQAIFGPKGSRTRESGRHGRKSRRARGFPDPNDMVGDRVRTVINPYDAFNFGPTRFAFRILNVYEGFNFAMALVDGLTDVGFETLWGVMTMNEQHCPGMQYLTRSAPGPITQGGIFPDDNPVNVVNLDSINLFNSPNGLGWNCHSSPYTVGASSLILNPMTTTSTDISLAIYTDDRGMIAQSSKATLGPGERIRLSVEGECDQGEFSWLATPHGDGFFHLVDVSVFAFGGTWF